MSKNWNMGKQDLIDLAIEFGMIRSTSAFIDLTARRQEVILKAIAKVADKIDFTGCFERR